MKNKNQYLLLHFIVLLWGLTPVLGKLISLQSIDLVFWRLVFSISSLYIFILFKKVKYEITPKQLLEILIMGFLVGIHWFFFYHAIKVSNVSTAMAGFSTITLFASVLQPILLQKKFFWGDAFFGAIILVGLIIIVSLENSLFWGIFYGVLGAFTGAFFGTYNGKLIQKHNSLYITLIEFIGAIILITVAKFFFSSNSFHIISLNSQDLFYLLVLSIFCTTLAFTLSVEIMKHFTPFTVIITNNLEPIYGVFFSVLLFKETELMSSKFYMGAVIILLTVFSYPFFNRKYNKNN